MSGPLHEQSLFSLIYIEDDFPDLQRSSAVWRASVQASAVSQPAHLFQRSPPGTEPWLSLLSVENELLMATKLSKITSLNLRKCISCILPEAWRHLLPHGTCLQQSPTVPSDAHLLMKNKNTTLCDFTGWPVKQHFKTKLKSSEMKVLTRVCTCI